MLTSIWSAVGSILTIIKTIFVGKNSDAEVTAKTAANLQKSDDAIQKDVTDGNLDRIRDDIA
jgi:hypothetical protein